MLNVLVNKPFPSLDGCVSNQEVEQPSTRGHCSSNTPIITREEEDLCNKPPLTIHNHTSQEFKQVRKQVENALREDEECRNNDQKLIWKIMRLYSPGFYVPFKDWKNMPSYETITRCRRLIQNKEHKYLPTSAEVIARRKTREHQVRELVRR